MNKQKREKALIEMMKADQESGLYEKNTHGGRRKGAGEWTLPEGEHKKIVEVYIKQKHIDKLGGKIVLKSKIRGFVYGLLGIPYIDDTK